MSNQDGSSESYVFPFSGENDFDKASPVINTCIGAAKPKTPKPKITKPTPIKSSSGTKKEATPAPPPEPPGVWEYSEDSVTFTPFDALTSRLIEATFKRDMTTVLLNHGAWVKSRGGWIVEFGPLTNTEKCSGKKTTVRRVPLPKSSKVYGCGDTQAKKKQLAKSDELHNPNFEADEGRKTHVQKLTGWTILTQIPEHDSCPVCLSALRNAQDQQVVVQLERCVGHYFHQNCIVHCGSESFVQCPICNEIYGTRTGTMPKGTMNVNVHKDMHCDGFPKIPTIVITYSFPDGTQGPEHPSPGTHYAGTSRTCYLPDTPEGREVLALLKIGWERRLLFRIGTSVTTGASNCVVWNDVHHKTCVSGGPTSFGYPDATYFERVKSELAAKGVRVQELKESERVSKVDANTTPTKQNGATTTSTTTTSTTTTTPTTHATTTSTTTTTTTTTTPTSKATTTTTPSKTNSTPANAKSNQSNNKSKKGRK